MVAAVEARLAEEEEEEEEVAVTVVVAVVVVVVVVVEAEAVVAAVAVVCACFLGLVSTRGDSMNNTNDAWPKRNWTHFTIES